MSDSHIHPRSGNARPNARRVWARRWIKFGLVVALLSPTPMSVAGPLPAPGVAAAPRGFWGNVAWLNRRIKLRCRTSAAGRFLTNALRPVSKLTGGLIPVPNDNHFAAAVELNATKPAGMAPGAVPKPPPPPPPGVAAAAQIKTERAQAKIRREAVAYLAGLDCRYYPEAEAALIASLRADRDQCVRLEAARALATGCCCTPATVKALTLCVTGSEDDGNPAERNSAVRRAALLALRKCETCVAAPSATPTLTPPEPALSSASQSDVTQVVYQTRPGENEQSQTLPPTPNASRPAGLLGLWRAASGSEPGAAR